MIKNTVIGLKSVLNKNSDSNSVEAKVKSPNNTSHLVNFKHVGIKSNIPRNIATHKSNKVMNIT